MSFKPEPKTVPLTIEDLYEHFKKGTIFKNKLSEWLMRIEAISLKTKDVSICCGEESDVESFINDYTFEDGSPLVKTIEE